MMHENTARNWLQEPVPHQPRHAGFKSLMALILLWALLLGSCAKKTATDTSDEVYDTAYLGAGASITYYIEMADAQAAGKAIIIGTEQPWRKKRGPGMINHPTHMITPLQDPKIDSYWMDRGNFSDAVSETLIQSGYPRIRQRVTKLEQEDRLWKISVGPDGQETIYARNVISGIGTGPYRLPSPCDSNDSPITDPAEVAAIDAKTIAFSVDDVLAGKRVMSIDTFVNWVYDERNKVDPSETTIVLVGGNAGIDAAYFSLLNGYKLEWIVSSGASFLPGMFNFGVAIPYSKQIAGPDVPAAAVTAFKDMLKQLGIPTSGQESAQALEQVMRQLYQGSLSGGASEIAANINTFSHQGAELEETYFLRLNCVACAEDRITAVLQDDVPTKVTGDYLVYALGNDNRILDLFADAFPDLMPLKDRYRRFASDPTTTIGARTIFQMLTVEESANGLQILQWTEIDPMFP